MDLPLTKQKCLPCEGGVPPISRQRAEELLARLLAARRRLTNGSGQARGGVDDR